MLCPLAKSNAALMTIRLDSSATIDSEAGKKLAQCNGNECALWHPAGEQCGILTIANELRNIRIYGAKTED